jgi:3-oxoacyl-[acyl-carrier protein] reductase
MDLGIRGRTALVTGASKGIGRAVAESLAREGADVVLVSRGGEALETAAQELRARHGVKAVGLACDLARAEEIHAMAGAAAGAIGPIDILVTNAGGPPSGPFDRTPAEAWSRAADLTLGSVVALCREVLPRMKERAWGRIVHLTSVSVKQPLTNLVLSNTLRAAVAGLSKTLAEEYAPFGITVNCIATGWTDTDRLDEIAVSASSTRGIKKEDVRAGWIAAIPSGRLARPEEIADATAFLASDRAAYITGAVVAVDGGFCRGLL